MFACGTLSSNGEPGDTTLGRIIAPNGQQSTMVAVGNNHAGFIAGMLDGGHWCFCMLTCYSEIHYTHLPAG